MKTAAFLLVWAALLFFGFAKLHAYSHTPAPPSTMPSAWPQDSAIEKSADMANLLVFVHPQCPCSVATVNELERLLPFLQGKAKTTVVFYRPKEKSAEWTQGSLWEKVKSLPGVEPILDNGGGEARKFNALTSGLTLLFDPQGALVFGGGITPARGHMGDSAGRDLILHYLETGKPGPLAGGPVFGCSLSHPERAIAGGRK